MALCCDGPPSGVLPMVITALSDISAMGFVRKLEARLHQIPTQRRWGPSPFPGSSSVSLQGYYMGLGISQTQVQILPLPLTIRGAVGPVPRPQNCSGLSCKWKPQPGCGEDQVSRHRQSTSMSVEYSGCAVTEFCPPAPVNYGWIQPIPNKWP